MVDDRVALDGDRSTLVAAHAGPHLVTAPARATNLSTLVGRRLELRSKDGHGGQAVSVLGASPVNTDEDLRRLVPEKDRGVGLVAVLTAGARAPAEALLEVGGVDGDLVLLGLLEDGDGDGAGLHAPPLLGWRNSLPSVASGLVLEGLERAFSDDSKG